MLDATDSIIAIGTAGAALITSIANGIVLVIKAARDKTVNTAVSTDLVTLGRNGGGTAPEELITPHLVTPAPPPPPAPPEVVSPPPAVPTG